MPLSEVVKPLKDVLTGFYVRGAIWVRAAADRRRRSGRGKGARLLLRRLCALSSCRSRRQPWAL